ncbi:MAG: hypothetical protein JWO82_2832, partial [Akkermansiaceae bacterium]|nr:hypothetical protein [Akkermansiaceae bacterium]
ATDDGFKFHSGLYGDGSNDLSPKWSRDADSSNWIKRYPIINAK